jgi:glucose-6-phosphate isomerase
MPENTHRPFTVDIVQEQVLLPRPYDTHIVRKLSALKGQFLDTQAFEALLEKDDPILYEVYEIRRPEVAGEQLQGLSILHPGKVGDEYYMTKGHFHSVLETAETYLCLQGEGYMVMETPEGEWAVEPLRPNKVLYVPPRWAHRSVNTSPDQDLVTFFVYPAHSGHDYGTIEKTGYLKLVVEQDGAARIVDNPRRQPAEVR